MHYLKDPKVLQFEISSNCNANCMGCSRADPFDKLKINPLIVKNQFLSLDLFKRIVLADSFEHVEEILSSWALSFSKLVRKELRYLFVTSKLRPESLHGELIIVRDLDGPLL